MKSPTAVLSALLCAAPAALSAPAPGPIPGPITDCPQARALHQASWAESDPRRRIAALRQAADACPEPALLIDLAGVYRGLGERDAAIAALEQAARHPDAAPHQVRIQTELARLCAEQGRLGEASAHVDLALRLAGRPAPPQLLALRRAIDTDPGRSRLSAGQIDRGLAATRAVVVPAPPGGPEGGRAFGVAAPRLDLYVLFDFDQDQPNAEGRAQAEELARLLAASTPGQGWRLTGHTDIQGRADYNQGLSERRAAAVRRLVEARAPALIGRLETRGRGETEPKDPGTDEAAHRINRRVELAPVP